MNRVWRDIAFIADMDYNGINIPKVYIIFRYIISSDWRKFL